MDQEKRGLLPISRQANRHFSAIKFKRYRYGLLIAIGSFDACDCLTLLFAIKTDAVWLSATCNVLRRAQGPSRGLAGPLRSLGRGGELAGR